ncbi:hypothetical protein MP228_005141 [Amoeboaphelidium protococcarum]|nr:hypothetical protein MP228_005141 [Amoeboaphelidium protococcarum]
MEAVLAAREHDYAKLVNPNGYQGYGQWNNEMMRVVRADSDSESDRSASPVAQRQRRQQPVVVLYAERERLERIEEIEDRLRERDEIIGQQRLEDDESVASKLWRTTTCLFITRTIFRHQITYGIIPMSGLWNKASVDTACIMMHDYDLGDFTTYEVEELQRKAVEVLRQMVSVGRSMEQMGGFIVAANSVDEYFHELLLSSSDGGGVQSFCR